MQRLFHHGTKLISAFKVILIKVEFISSQKLPIDIKVVFIRVFFIVIKVENVISQLHFFDDDRDYHCKSRKQIISVLND